jgi:hypothetical protein
MTVGCVIFTVPRRKRVSQAVTDETASDKTEIVSDIGSTMLAPDLKREHRDIQQAYNNKEEG